MALTPGDLRAIEQLLDRKLDAKLDEKLDEKLEPVHKRLDSVEVRLDSMNDRLDTMQEDIAEIKEHAEVTRSATNSLVEWADAVGVITRVDFPIKKVR